MPKSPTTKRPGTSVRGAAAEARALAFLQQQGLTLVEQNFSCRWGEIDLILRDQETLVFVEVRQRSSARFGGAAASVSAGKQAKLWRTAEVYLQRIRRIPVCRFDLIAIDGDQLEWMRHILTR
jgi:putative endonuclease